VSFFSDPSGEHLIGHRAISDRLPLLGPLDRDNSQSDGDSLGTAWTIVSVIELGSTRSGPLVDVSVPAVDATMDSSSGHSLSPLGVSERTRVGVNLFRVLDQAPKKVPLEFTAIVGLRERCKEPFDQEYPSLCVLNPVDSHFGRIAFVPSRGRRPPLLDKQSRQGFCERLQDSM
jgi:hypothetical protein